MAVEKNNLKKSDITLGPLLFHWDEDKARDFYFKIADEAPIDKVYIGEVVCSKRAPFHAKYIPEAVERLQSAGKEVILSTLQLVMNNRELNEIRDTAGFADDMMIEANDLSAVNLLAGKPHSIGTFVNIYNIGTLKVFEQMGAKNICLPGELPSTSIKTLAGAASTSNVEVYVFGRLPLAISARCYHARAHNLHKDNCQYVCGLDSDGMNVNTISGQPFLAANGLQTMSQTCCELSGEIEELQSFGVSGFRLSPHDVDMVQVSNIYRDIADSKIEKSEARSKLEEEVDFADFSNGFYHGTVGKESIESVA